MKIRRGVVELALEMGRESYPDEFVAVLTGKRGIIEEITILPFISGTRSAVIRMDLLPLGIRVYGTVHSHPSPSCRPSLRDLEMFSKFGIVHMIVCYPFEEGCWAFYDRRGSPVEVEIVD